MLTTTNHGAAVPLPDFRPIADDDGDEPPLDYCLECRAEGCVNLVDLCTKHGAIGKQIIRALKATRERWTGPMWVVWAPDVENAVIDEERAQLRFRAPPETPDREAKRDGSVTFLTHRKVPAGTWYVTTTEPTELLQDYGP